MMLDVSRHFHDVDFVKKQLDVMAMFKIIVSIGTLRMIICGRLK